MIMNDTLLLKNEEKCPFAQNSTPATVNDSSMPGKNNDENTLLSAPQTKALRLRNYQTGESIEVKVPASSIYRDCRDHVCTSTLMSFMPHTHGNKTSNGQSSVNSELVLPEHILKDAFDFLLIYHNDKGTSDMDYQRRLDEIDREIQQTGTYTHTTDELEYGCQLAWRNAARCINRLYWRTLKVIDRRQIKNNDEMFQEICDHLRMAYNNGVLQATTLVMSRNARLWSTQYLRYACYEQADGSLLGDPLNRELTRAIMELGWDRRIEDRTQWDLLPIVVQCDPNEHPSWYDLPQDLRPEVFLSHPDPKYDAAIKSLGLRWIAQPFVSDKAIEIGGIVYHCVPFSGWFMQTEVGRDLCDIQRYNMIPKLAALLNLDITAAANNQMNIDRLYLEINAAVLYSFEKAKVAIVDHHTAVTGFMKYFNQERKQRGNTPADWVWLVPPISGGMSSVFHQEMLNYVMKPCILDQHDPWTHYAPLLRNKKIDKLSLADKRRHRWLVIRAACAIIGYALAVVKKRIGINVLYASASGTAQSYAQQMTNRLTVIGYNAKLMELDSYPFQQVSETRSIIFIITSTFGQGNAPEGGQKVEEWLRKEINADNTRINIYKTNSENMRARSGSIGNGNCPLKRYTYAVCAIGSLAYPFFCGFGQLIDRSLQTLGAQRLVPIATCDALNQQYKSYMEWEESAVTALKSMYPHSCSDDKTKRSSSLLEPPTRLRTKTFVEQQVDTNVSIRPNYIPLTFNLNTDGIRQPNQAGTFTKENPFIATVLQNIELIGDSNAIGDAWAQESQQKYSGSMSSTVQMKKRPILPKFTSVSSDKNRSVRLITFDTTGLSYYPGDHVCILPENSLANVNGVISACGWQLGNKLLSEPCSLASYTHNRYTTIRQILTQFVDLTTTPRPHTLNIIATYATNQNEQRQLLELGKGGQRYSDWLVNLPTVKEMLEEFSSIKISLDELIQLLPQLQPRYYSISSSNRFHPNQLHITVSVVTYRTPRGIIRKGVCSNYLQQTLPSLSQSGRKVSTPWQRNASKVRLFISPNSHFRLPGQDNLNTNLTSGPVINGGSLSSLNSPILMFAVGSGIAPFRSFWQELQVLERLNEHVQVRRVLFMGCRTSNDFLFAKELRSLVDENLLTTVIPVYSRATENAKRYIQDAMLDHESLIYSILTIENGFVYMCGSTHSCQGIESALASILQSHSVVALTQTQANDTIKQFKESGRIKQDMFG